MNLANTTGGITMLCEMHCHSSGISYCSHIPYNELVDITKAAGFDAMVLTNHYCRDYLKAISYEDWIEDYINEYSLAHQYGKTVGMKVFLGVEVTVDYDLGIHMLLYGITPELLRRDKNLFEKSLEELSNYCRNNGITLIQAHPFRYGRTVQEPSLLDGIEINCHPGHEGHTSDIVRIAKENKLSVTCGNDYHGDTSYRPRGGMILPDNIETDQELALYIKNTSEFSLRVHEVGDSEPYPLIVKIDK